MDIALRTLLRLHRRALWRRVTRGARSPRGLMYFLVGLSVAGLWLGPQIVRGIYHPFNNPDRVREITPLILLSICLMTLVTNGGGRAVYFTPAEVDFLFPGPFRRREVLLYKIAKSAGAAMVGSLIFSCVMLSKVSHWLAGYVAIVLAMMFLQLFSMTLVLVGQSISERIFSQTRKWLIIAIVAAGIFVFSRQTPHQAAPTIDSVLAWIRDHRAVQLALLPLSVFGQVATAQSLLIDLPKWAAAGIVVDGILLMIVLWLDADYMETAAATSERLYARRQRARRGQGMTSATLSASLALPPLPRLWGAGPLAWRQLTTALRSARTTLIILCLATLFAAAFVQRFMQIPPLTPVLIMGGWLTLFTTNLLRFDFRGDLDQIDALKALPLASWTIVVGELAAPVTILSMLHLLCLLGLALVDPRQATIAGSVAIVVIPLNCLFSLIENLIFLVFPVRELNVSPGDLQGTGRRMIVLVLKLMGVLVVGGIATTVAAFVYALLGRSLPLACGTAGVVLLGADVALVPLLGWAFVRFDPSVDTPT